MHAYLDLTYHATGEQVMLKLDDVSALREHRDTGGTELKECGEWHLVQEPLGDIKVEIAKIHALTANRERRQFVANGVVRG